MSERPQSFESHAKIVTGYHGWATLFLVAPTLYFGYRAAFRFTWGALALFVFAVGVVLTAFYARSFPLGVQDRVIRLEERLRLERLFPADMKPRIPDFTTDQLVALRFASDEELPGLARRVLDEKIMDKREIKRAIKSWRADHQRI
jgi:hypothetical protein